MNFNGMVKSGYFMYMAETSGLDNLVNTRTAKINASIKELRNLYHRGYNPNDYIDTVLANHGLTEDMLSDVECARISREVMY